jgi:hypothetical protein
MAMNLGNYSNQLSMDDYDKALANSGYVPEQNSLGSVGQNAVAANPYSQAMQSVPVKQASDAEMAPDLANAYGRPTGGAAYGQEKKKDEGGGLGKVLGIVGKIAAFL